MKKQTYLFSIAVLVLLCIFSMLTIIQNPPELSLYDLYIKGTEIERTLDTATIQIEHRVIPPKIYNFRTAVEVKPVIDLLKSMLVFPDKAQHCRLKETIQYIVTIQYGNNQLSMTLGCLERGGEHYHLRTMDLAYSLLEAICQRQEK